VKSISRTVARGQAARRTQRPRRSRHPFGLPRSATIAARPPLFVAIGIVVGGLTLGTALAQQAPASDATIDAGGRTGDIVLVDRGQLAPGLAEVRLTYATDAPPASGANRVLAIGPAGSAAAVATQVGPDPTTLTIVRGDGSQQRVSLPGLIGAGFAPDGSWLAVIDGSGRIWHVATENGAAARLADGPFLGSPIIAADGSILALRVSSVEAPIMSRLVRIGPDGSIATLSEDELVYGAQVLADGSVAYAAHRGSETFLMQLAASGPAQLADLGQDAVNVGVSPSGDAVAFERAGQVFLRRIGDSDSSPLIAGTHPVFAPDGRSILVELAQGSVLVGRDGHPIASFDSQAGFAACQAGCAS
jgi:hypothetical protein